MPGVATVARRSSTPSSDWATWRYRSGRDGILRSDRVCAEHRLGLGAQPAGHSRTEPHAAADARPHPAFHLARQGATPFWRCAQPPGDGRDASGLISHRDHPRHAQQGAAILWCVLLLAADGLAPGDHHRSGYSALRSLQQNLHAADAPTDTRGAQERFRRPERPAGDHPTPDAHQDTRRHRPCGR